MWSEHPADPAVQSCIQLLLVQNLLVDNLTSCRVKLCDMGSCKFMGALGEGSERAPDVHASTPRVT